MDEWGSFRMLERMREFVFEVGLMLRLLVIEVMRVERMVICFLLLLERYVLNILIFVVWVFNFFLLVVGFLLIILVIRVFIVGLVGIWINLLLGCLLLVCIVRRGDMSKEERRFWFVEDVVKIGVRVERYWDLIDGGVFDVRDSLRR